jgi:hypothetical protein
MSHLTLCLIGTGSQQGHLIFQNTRLMIAAFVLVDDVIHWAVAVHCDADDSASARTLLKWRVESDAISERKLGPNCQSVHLILPRRKQELNLSLACAAGWCA